MSQPSNLPANSPNDANARETELRQLLRRCNPRTIDAAIRFQRKRSPDLINTIVMGIMAWFLDQSALADLDEGIPDMRIAEDLGVDSLLLLEIIIVLEDVFSISIADQDVSSLKTLNEVTGYIQKQSFGQV